MNAANERRVGYATSPDGITWTKYGSTRCWELVAPEPGIRRMSAIPTWSKLGPTNTRCGTTARMGAESGIGYATSPDGITWTKSGTAAVLPYLGYGWDSTPYHPSVIYDGKGYHMWYSGCNYSGSDCQIGYATSPDGATWTRRQMVLPLGATGAFDDDQRRLCQRFSRSAARSRCFIPATMPGYTPSAWPLRLPRWWIPATPGTPSTAVRISTKQRMQWRWMPRATAMCWGLR